MLGGSASHFSISASFFTNVSIVGVVGGDFTEQQVFDSRGIGTRDLERIEEGKTFRWGGRYDYDLNTAHTLFTDLNVFADFQPKISDESKGSRLLFLGNIQPDRLVACLSNIVNTPLTVVAPLLSPARLASGGYDLTGTDH